MYFVLILNFLDGPQISDHPATTIRMVLVSDGLGFEDRPDGPGLGQFGQSWSWLVWDFSVFCPGPSSSFFLFCLIVLVVPFVLFDTRFLKSDRKKET